MRLGEETTRNGMLPYIRTETDTHATTYTPIAGPCCIPLPGKYRPVDGTENDHRLRSDQRTEEPGREGGREKQ